METIKLYEKAPYEREFKSRIAAVKEEERIWAALEASLFYPEGGGQPCDYGTLNEWKVVDVQEKDGMVWHALEGCREIPQAGMEAVGVIDWDRRYRNMQNHTGEHLVSGIIHQKFGYDNVGFHMGQAAITIDFNGTVTAKQLEEVERMANAAIGDNIPLVISYPSREQLQQLEYRSKKEIAGQVRLVSIPEFDTCACCGIHTRNTGEIRLIKILSVQNYKGGVRIAMLSGQDAIEDYQMKHLQVQNSSRLLSAQPFELEHFVGKSLKEAAALREKIALLQREIQELKVASIEPGQEMICLFEEHLDKVMHRELVNKLVEKGHLVIVCSSGGDGTYSYIMGSRQLDVRPAGKALNEAFCGRGGGQAQMVQGKITASEKEIRSFMEQSVSEF